MKEPTFEVFEGLDDSYLPSCKTRGSVGLDVKASGNFFIKPNQSLRIGVGVKIKDCDPSVYFELHLRSSLRSTYTSDGVGIIDSDYRGEIQVTIRNTTNQELFIKKGDRIAQLIMCENLTQKYASKYCLNKERNGGFGSTDKNN